MHIKPSELKKGDIIRTEMDEKTIIFKRTYRGFTGTCAYIHLSDDSAPKRFWDEIPSKCVIFRDGKQISPVLEV